MAHHGRAEGPKDHGKHDEPKVDATEQFEEYTAPPRLDEKGQPIHRSKGLNAAGYRFPPAGGPQPPLTKENLAKGIGVPALERRSSTTEKAWPVPPLSKGPGSSLPTPVPTANHPPAPVVKVHEDPLFEEYQRPDLKQHPRTGAGLRTDPPAAPTAKELLENYQPPVPEVHTPKRFSVLPARARIEADRSQAEDAAHLDAVADSLIATDAVMSNPVVNGPLKTVVHTPDDDLFAPAPEVPQAQPGPSPLPASASPPPADPLPRPAAWGPAPAPATPAHPLPSAPHRATTLALDPAHPAPVASPAAPTMVPPMPAPVHPPQTAPYMPPAGAAVPPPLTTTPVLATAPLAEPVHAVQAPPHPSPRALHAPAMAPEPAPMADPATPRRSSASAPHGSDAPAPAPGGVVPRIGLVQCDFNHAITTAMALSAHQEARRLHAPIAHHVHVPGVFDAPLAAKHLLERDDIDAVVVVGCVIQGETGHDEVITHAAAQTLLALACNSGKPVGLGVTGPRMTRAQAEARVSSGAFAVASVVAQHRLLKTV